MESYNLYDIGSEVISSHVQRGDPKKVKRILLALDPLCPKRAYSKLSKLLAMVVIPRTKYVS